ncbi:MAG: SPOR domain-containing protein [Gammaproteobacteria bacterium]|jgi:DedD protein|nr:SPOR domain-containing protein [Gammaproteobacteria bacterium]
MDKTLQQRLVGAVVLVALGVILLPALLDGDGYSSRHDRDIQIPAKPRFTIVEEEKLEPAVIPTPMDARRETQEQASTEGPSEPIQSWTLQVGTFSQEDNALAFRTTLRKQGYTAYLESSRSNGEKSYRVFIGPELEIAQLEKIKAKLKAEKNIDAFILRHP